MSIPLHLYPLYIACFIIGFMAYQRAQPVAGQMTLRPRGGWM